MGQLTRFADFVQEYHGRADFAVLYLEEAHPTDGWMYPAVQYLTKQATVLGERMAMARVLCAEMKRLGCPAPVFADSMSNAASRVFGALPERLAILLNGEVKFVGGKGPEGYSIIDARDALQACLA